MCQSQLAVIVNKIGIETPATILLMVELCKAAQVFNFFFINHIY
jgi:hypothetical protein